MICLEKIPSGLEEAIRYYGKPWVEENGVLIESKEWRRENLGSVTLPHSLRYSWKDERLFSFACHKKVCKPVQDAILEIGSHGGWEWLVLQEFDRWGGCYNPRSKRSTPLQPSAHFFGIAIDLNPHIDPQGEPPKMPWFIVDAFVKRGFIWGGDFKRKDGQHFQALENY